jgi:hypothetical protein
MRLTPTLFVLGFCVIGCTASPEAVERPYCLAYEESVCCKDMVQTGTRTDLKNCVDYVVGTLLVDAHPDVLNATNIEVRVNK